MSTCRGDRELRRILDESFRPAFVSYENTGGIPLDVLQNLLSESDIPPERTKRFFKYADRNKNQRVDYDEFLQQVMFEDPLFQKKLKTRKRILNHAVFAFAPLSARRFQRKSMRRAGIDETDFYNWGDADVNSYVEAYDCSPPPLFIPLITLSQIAVFIYYLVMLALDDNQFNDIGVAQCVPSSNPLIYSPIKRYQVWRFFSYMFIHCSYYHLIFNCILQLFLGSILELVHKFWRVGIVYLLGVLAGSLAHSVTDPFSYLAGASGGCYALIGAHLATIIINWKTMQSGWSKSPLHLISSAASRLTIILLLGVCDTGFAIYSRLMNSSNKISLVSHLGGFVAGILVGVPVLRNLEIERWEKVCFWVSIFVYSLFMIVAILFNGFCEQKGWCLMTIWN